MGRLFHSCAYVNSNKTWKLIAKGHDCIVRTNKCSCKNATDIATSIKTMSMTKSEGAASLKTIIDNLKDKEKDNDIILSLYISF